MSTLSLLQRVSSDCVIDVPFPHVVVENALPSDLYDELARALPADAALRQNRQQAANSYYRIASASLLDDANSMELSARWREFIAYHVSPAFYAAGVKLFDTRLADHAATIVSRYGKPLEALTAGPRFTEQSTGYQAMLECQLVHTSPPEKLTRSVGPHVDREVTLWAGLFYMRHPDDDSRGGDLLLYRFRHGVVPEYWKERKIPDTLVEQVKVIPYRENTFVMFLQSAVSVHGVSHREPTCWGRNYVNLVCEFPFRVFDLGGHRVNQDRFPVW